MAFQTPLHFVIPDPKAFPSGGNLYNQYLIEALQGLGQAANQMDWQAFMAEEENPQPGVYYFDTLYLKHLALNPPAKHVGCSWRLLVHHLESLYPPPNWKPEAFFEHFELPVLQNLDGFLATSTFTEKYLRNKGLTQPIATVDPALLVQPNGVQEVSQLPLVVLVANVVERKGVLPLLEAMAEKVKKEDFFFLQIIGSLDLEPGYVHSCLKLVADSSVLKSKVIFSGSLQREVLSQYYAQAILFLSSSFMETYGMALQEAVAFGLPILTLEGGNAAAHVETGKNGYVYDEINDLSEGFINLIRDPERLNSLRQTALGFRPYDQYSWDDAAGHLIDSLEGESAP